MPEALGTVKTGAYGVTDLFVDQRKYDKDKSKFFIWRERGHAPLVHVLITKIPKMSATDPEPKHFEDGYRTFEFASNLGSASSSGTLEDQIRFTTANADQMQVGDLLTVDAGADTSGLWTSITGALGATTIAYGNRSATNASREVVKVVSKAAPSGGNVVVTVRRGVGADTNPTAPPDIPTATLFWHSGEVAEDGADSRNSFSQNPVTVNNYMQIFSVPYEITDIASATDIFGENEWQRKARNARRDFARRLERGFINGRMWKETGTGGQLVWYTGGLDEWVPNDSTHRISAGRPLSQTYFNTAMKDVFLFGSEDKWLFGGYTFKTKFDNAAADKIRYNETLSNDIGLDAYDFKTSGGGTIHFMPDYEMSQTGMDDEALIADTQYLAYMYMAGMDIHIDKGKDGQGLQGRGEKKLKHQIYGVIGMKRQYRDTHFQLYNIT